MPSDRAVRWSAFAFSIFFVVVVSLGYIPGLNATPHVHNPDAAPMAPGEHMMMGLYVISLLDDVTHALSAILLFVGALHSARMSRLALTAFGWYYAYDATIYIVTGILQQKPLGPNLGLNGPHVLISSIMLFLAYRGRVSVPKASVEQQGAGTYVRPKDETHNSAVRKQFMPTLIALPLAAAVVVGILLAFRRGARKFEARRIAEGAWGPDGPLKPTHGAPGWLRPPRGEIFETWVFKNRRKWYGSRDAAPFKSVSAEKRKKRPAGTD